MAVILATARSRRTARIRLTCRWILDPATGRLVRVWEEDPLPRSCLCSPRLAA
jgi:hypothetical protein